MNLLFFHGRHRAVKLCGVGLGIALGMICLPDLALADDRMPAPNPTASLANSPNPHLVVLIKFAADGHVASCKAIKKSGSPQLDKFTVDFIKKNWDCPSMGGHTAQQPIDYRAPPPQVAAQPTTNAPQTPANSYAPTSSTGGFGGGGGGGSPAGGYRAH